MRASRLLPGLLAVLLALPTAASAGGPRYVTGPPFFTGAAGVPIGWKQPTLNYFTDPGALSASVNHQAADALVLAAAAAWNVPVAGITVARGGALAEHVSGQNTYLDTSGLVFPADVMSTNAAAIPVAVIYDTDGSVTDLLLGSGASQPASCRQNAVTETVDSFDPAGYILHAILVVNGRCTGAAPELQLELQYQMERAFGRVLGLAWSQTNDNVFTGTPTPTYNQALNWPIMHPLDILCGPYAYQCLPSPFQLRADDIAGLVGIYPVAQKSLANAHTVAGHVYFATGEGMAGVNVLVRRQAGNSAVYDGWYEASAITGGGFRSAAGSPFVATDTSAFGSFGTTDTRQIGSYLMPYVPIEEGAPWQDVAVSTEAINPLYLGTHGLVPYVLGAVAPSGSTPAPQIELGLGPGNQAAADFTIADAAPVCGNGGDGTAQAPMAMPATGWWTGLLCGYAHASYLATAVTPGRSFTLEVTALDEQGLATLGKAMPVIGVFAPTDQPGDLPSLAVAPTAFNATSIATTTLGVATGQLTSLWFGIADERDDGRPDFQFQARMFYADNLLPAELPVAGGRFTLNGTGFRAGNAVTVNGVAATVVSWTANTIVVTAPTMAAAGAISGAAVDVQVRDLSTGATSTMSSALTYTSATRPNTLRLVSAPAGTVYVGDSAAPAFAVQLLGPDGVTPVAGASIVFTVPAGSAQFSACSAAVCTVVTDVNGKASTSVTPQAAGAITIQAADGALTQSASFNAEPQISSILFWYYPTGNLPEGNAQTLALVERSPGNTAGRAVTFTVPKGAATFSPCNTSVCTAITDGSGNIVLQFTPTVIGPLTIVATDGDVSASLSFAVVNSADTMVIASLPTPSVYVDSNSGAFAVTLVEADGVSTDTNETVTFTAPAEVLLYPCGSNVCSVSTGWSGTAQVGIGAQQPGTFSIKATYGSLSQSVSIIVLPHSKSLQIVSAPSGNVPVATTATTPFSAQLLQDGVTPLGGWQVTLAGAQGAVLLNACINRASCSFFTDANGMVSTAVTPLVPGAITLDAIFENLTEVVSFSSVGPAQTMTIAQQPGAAGALVGDTVNLAVQVTAAGGGPLVNDLIDFTIVSGAFSFGNYYEASLYTYSDGNGIALLPGIAGGPGPVTILVTDGTASVNITFIAIARPSTGKQDTLTALNPRTWISEGSMLTLALDAHALENGSAVVGQAVAWTPAAGFQSATLSTATDSTGATSTLAVLGPLAAGASASMTACAWTSVCAAFQATGVALAAQQVSVIDGGLQTVTGAASPAPVVAQVTDAAGHPIAAAQVSIYQTVRGYTACPAQGRCPAAPVLGSQATVAVSGLDGSVSIVPLTVPGTSTQTELAFSVGTSGFATAVVTNP